MLVMSAKDICKSYGTDIIIEDVSFSVNKGDKVGIVGPNGAGKTTLLSIIAGENEPTSGDVFIRSGYVVGYLKQKDHFFSEGTVIEEAAKTFTHFYEMEEEISSLEKAISDTNNPKFDQDLEAYTHLMDKYKAMGGYSYKSELIGVLASMGFGADTHDKEISMLSGGEKTRLALACMMLQKPDILMLDEPTNHLDLKMLAWLESFLKTYKGTIIVVSHDRYFLDRIVNRIFDMRGTHLVDYRGNYSEYLVKRSEREEVMRREYEKQQKEIARQEEIIRRFKQHNTEHLVKRAQSREKRLAHLEVLDRPSLKQAELKLSFDADFKSGKDVIMTEELSKSFGEKQLFRDVKFDIKSGEKICFIGDNGVGKTTLLRIIMGEEEADEGYLKIGHNVDFGYYDQEQLLLDEDETVLGEMKNAYHLYTDTEMRNILGRFLFRGDDVFKSVSALSGGEKARLSLLKLMLSGANTLIFDEPTNHLDIESKEIVEAAIMEFKGTVLIVSHDRYLLSKIPDRILELRHDGIREYKGKFDYYLEKSAEFDKKDVEIGEDENTNDELSAEEERRIRKEREAEERRRSRRISELEAIIHDIEAKIEEIESEMCKPEHASDVFYLREAGDKALEYKNELEVIYDEWLSLQEDE